MQQIAEDQSSSCMVGAKKGGSTQENSELRSDECYNCEGRQSLRMIWLAPFIRVFIAIAWRCESPRRTPRARTVRVPSRAHGVCQWPGGLLEWPIRSSSEIGQAVGSTDSAACC